MYQGSKIEFMGFRLWGQLNAECWGVNIKYSVFSMQRLSTYGILVFIGRGPVAFRQLWEAPDRMSTQIHRTLL